MQSSRKLFYRLLCAALALILLPGILPGARAAAETAAVSPEDPVVVRVGSFVYPLSVVQKSLDSDLELSELLRGAVPTGEEREARLQGVVDSFVGLGVMENRLAEAGKNTFSDAEQEELNRTARARYEDLWQLLYQQMQEQDAGVTEAAVTSQLEAMGYTFEAILAEVELQERQNRAIDLFCGNLVLTQEQVDAYYEEQFVAPDRADYENDIDRYDQEILMNNNEAFYTPEGYRYIRQIVLAFPEEAQNAARSEEARVNRATQAMTSALQGLTQAAMNADSWTEELAAAKAAYTEAEKELEAAQAAWLSRLKAASLPLLQETVDAILEQYGSGVEFRLLINRYSTDKTDRNLNGEGYPFHPDSKLWPEAYARAASRLKKPGDLSDPVATEQGIHILLYAGDVPAGAHVLTEEERELLNASAERFYQLQKLNSLLEAWQADYEIETHPELLTY